MSTPQERAQAFFDSVPEPEGTIEEILEADHIAAWMQKQREWGLPGGYVYGAIARAEALAAGDPDWMTVTKWPREAEA